MVAESFLFDGVWKGYSRGGGWTQVLAGISLEVRRGEIAAVTGGRLAGKTTVLKIAAGLERPDRGSVRLGDEDLAALKDRQRSKLLGREIVWIDRNGPHLKLEVSKFVGWPLTLHGTGRRQVEQMAARALERVGAQECMGRRWGELSTWQQVLVGLARAFVGDPRLIVVDDLLDALGEPDTEQASDLLRSLLEAPETRCGVLMSASDADSAIYADKIWTITSKHTLKPLAGQEGNVIPLRKRVGGL